MSETAIPGLDLARETFEREGLALPPVPDRFKVKLRMRGEWCFATRSIDGLDMYLFRHYIEEALTKQAPDYVAFGHSGHGINSYAITYQLLNGPLAVFVQAAWGGGYSDKVEDTTRVNRLLARCAELISAGERAMARGLTGSASRLVVIESEMRECLVLGWLERPLRGPAVPQWLRTHSVDASRDPSGIQRGDLPTVAAVRWLNEWSPTGSGLALPLTS